MPGLIGKKIGMTSIFDKDGKKLSLYGHRIGTLFSDPN